MSETVQAVPGENVIQPPLVKPTTLPLIIYILMFIGFPFALAAVAGVIMAYVNRSDSDDEVIASHYAYQIKTFWWGLLWVFLGFLLTFVVVGYLVLLVWLVWTLYRLIKGLSAWNKYQIVK
jgi:uncharacterized membrane protein